jgi:hypothetical protein
MTTIDSIAQLNDTDRSIAQAGKEVVTAAQFLIRKEREHRHVVGIVGFTEEWSEEKLASNHILKEQNRFARGELEGIIRDLQAQHGEKLLISTEALMSRHIFSRVLESCPYWPSPISASPESLSITRR